VYFSPAGATQTVVTLELEYAPEGLVEKAGDALNLVERQAQADVERFKAIIESSSRCRGSRRGGRSGRRGSHSRYVGRDLRADPGQDRPAAVDRAVVVVEETPDTTTTVEAAHGPARPV
jgi:hypothetical protein